MGEKIKHTYDVAEQLITCLSAVSHLMGHDYIQSKEFTTVNFLGN